MGVKTKKKIIAFFCTLMLILTSFGTIYAQSTPKGDSIEYDEATINKYISNADEKNNLYDIILEVEGKDKAANPPTDVMLVMDESNSMTGDKFEKAKSAINTFANKLLAKSLNVNIGYVGFANNVPSDKIQPLTNDKTVFTNFIESQASNIGGGSHIQSGLKEAREILESRPAGNRKIMIILSDGLATYSYKPTSVAPLSGNEVQAHGYKEPTFKVTGYDYTTTIGSGGTFDLLEDTFKIGNDIISGTGDPTIGELLQFKQNPNTTVYSIGIDVANTPPSEGAYSHINDKTSVNLGDYSIAASWDEKTKNSLYDPNEKITVTAEYTNESANTRRFTMWHNVVQDDDPRPIPAKTRDFVQNTGDVICNIYKNDTIIESLTFDEIMNRADSTISIPEVTLAPGETYKIVTEFTMKDFVLMGPGQDSLNTMHIAQYQYRLEEGVNSMSGTAFGFKNTYFGPLLAFHSPYETKAQGEYILKNLSSDGVENSTYFDVLGVENLLDTLVNNILATITDSVENGTIDDPMGEEYIQLQTGAFNGKDYKIWAEKNGISNTSLLEGVKVNYNKNTKTLKVTGLNLSKGEKVFIKYKVKLLTSAKGFKYDTWYNTNGKTTLTPYSGGEKREFPSPQVSAQKTGDTQSKDPDKPIDSSKTGDNNNMLLWLGVTLLSASALGALIIIRKKHKA